MHAATFVYLVNVVFRKRGVEGPRIFFEIHVKCFSMIARLRALAYLPEK
jgi:hypothetical protein